jgi:hypothetical protein
MRLTTRPRLVPIVNALPVGLHGLALGNNFRFNFSNLVKTSRDEFYCQLSIASIVGYVKHDTQLVHIIPSVLN